MAFVYADNAATTPLDFQALAAMMPYLKEEFGNASQPYLFAHQPSKAIENARQTVARCINAEPDEIFFTSGGTESNNLAVKGIAFACKTAGNLLISAVEHYAVIRSCRSLEQFGFSTELLPVSADGTVLPETLKKKITPKTRLVSVMLANNEIGTVEPVAQLAKIAHENGALFHTDAVQAVGHIPIDVKALGVDMLSASAHKFNGPKGVGFLYVRKGTPIVPLCNGGSQENGLRAGTENVAGIVGLAKALEKKNSTLFENAKHLQKLEKQLLLKLAGASPVQNGAENHLPGLVSLSFPGIDAEGLLHVLDLNGICVSAGAACNRNFTEISHVLKAIGLQEEAAHGTIRISFGTANTEEDVDQIAHAILHYIDAIGRKDST